MAEADRRDAADEASASADAAPAEEAKPQKTLEEYLAERNSRAAKVSPAAQIRKANEGTDESKWADATLVHEGNDEASTAPATSTDPAIQRKSQREKVTLDVDIKFARQSPRERPTWSSESRRGGKGRGAKDSGRGAKDSGRSGNQKNKSASESSASGRGRGRGSSRPHMTNEDFPSL